MLRKGPPFHLSRSSREMKNQNGSCQMRGHEVTRRLKCFFQILRENERSRSYREIIQHPNLPWNFITHGFLDLSVFPKQSGNRCRIDAEFLVTRPLSHCISCGIADYRCYTPTSVPKNGLSQSKDRPNKGSYRRKKLASEAYRAIGVSHEIVPPIAL